MDNLDVGQLSNDLNDSDPGVRERAVAVIHHAGLRTSTIDEKISSLLRSDTSKKVRIAAIRLISETGDPAFKEVLQAQLYDKDGAIRGRAFIGLQTIDPGFKETDEAIRFVQQEKSPLCLAVIQAA